MAPAKSSSVVRLPTHDGKVPTSARDPQGAVALLGLDGPPAQLSRQAGPSPKKPLQPYNRGGVRANGSLCRSRLRLLIQRREAVA